MTQPDLYAAGYAWGRSDEGAHLDSDLIMGFAVAWAKAKEEFKQGHRSHLPSLPDFYVHYNWGKKLKRPANTAAAETMLTPVMHRAVHGQGGKPFVLAIDVSGSSDHDVNVKWFDAVGKYPTCAGVVAFNHEAKVVLPGQPLPKPQGGTDLGRLRRVIEEAYSDGNNVIVLTDGLAQPLMPDHPERWTWVLYQSRGYRDYPNVLHDCWSMTVIRDDDATDATDIGKSAE